MWHSPIFVAFGSNLGDREANVLSARDALAASEEVTVECFSSLYRSRAMYDPEQPDFVNAVCRCKTRLSPHSLLARFKAVERALGRIASSRRYAPRVIDLDLLYYEQRLVEEANLAVPHPRRTERAFVLVPLAEIAPSFLDPQHGCSVAELKRRLEREGGVTATLQKVHDEN